MQCILLFLLLKITNKNRLQTPAWSMVLHNSGVNIAGVMLTSGSIES